MDTTHTKKHDVRLRRLAKRAERALWLLLVSAVVALLEAAAVACAEGVPLVAPVVRYVIRDDVDSGLIPTSGGLD